MKTCICCSTELDIISDTGYPTATLICPPCMKNVVLRSPRRMMCKLHKHTINPEEVTPSDSPR